jgi:integrase
MRTTKPHVKKWKWGGPATAWVVDGLRDENGARKRKFFPSRDAANEWLAERRPELKNQGRAALGMTDRQRVDAIRALALLAPFNATLTAAAEAFAERARVLSRTVTFAKLREEYLNAQRADRKSAQYLTDIKHRLLRVGKTFDERPVATIETRELDDWLRGLSSPAEGSQSPISRRNFRKVMRTAFEFAVSRGYARENPVVRTAEVKVDHAAPGILKAHEIAAVLAVADATIIPAIALAAFAGLRDAEVGRMTWDRIDLTEGYVRVDAAIAKTSSRRLIPISDNLRGWLTPHVKKTGLVRPAQSVASPLQRAARAEALKTLTKAEIPAPNLKEWPHNAYRHSFVSYRMALVTNASQVAEECGHSVQVMKTHYRELVTKKDAEAWFAVVLAEQPENIVQFAKQAAG